MDLRTAAFAGFSQETMQTLRDALNEKNDGTTKTFTIFYRNSQRQTIYHIRPSTKTKHAIFTTSNNSYNPSSRQPAISKLPRPQRQTEPMAKSRSRPSPKMSPAPPQSNCQEGGASRSGSNPEERTPQAEEPVRKGWRKAQKIWRYVKRASRRRNNNQFKINYSKKISVFKIKRSI